VRAFEHGRFSYRFAGVLLSVSAILPRVSLGAEAEANNPLQLSPHHVTALVANLDAESRWYQRVLGFQEVKRVADGSDFAMRQLTVPGCRIDLVWRRASTKRAPDGASAAQGWLHVVFQTPDINAAFKRLTALGTDVKADRNANNIVEHLTFHDPEGNEIGIALQ
jgi:catechol 2,3-dioxygenase-like lactoylglutathione lyase family enzyme